MCYIYLKLCLNSWTAVSGTTMITNINDRMFNIARTEFWEILVCVLSVFNG